MISLVVASTTNNGIGAGNKMLWDIKDLHGDMTHFKELTIGNTVIMGRKTYESIGKALDGRTNIVLTRDPNFYVGDCYVYESFSQLKFEIDNYVEPDEEVFVIGGGEVYKLFFPYADRIYHTVVMADHLNDEADAFFPIYKFIGEGAEWEFVSEKFIRQNEKNKYGHCIYKFDRIKGESK